MENSHESPQQDPIWRVALVWLVLECGSALVGTVVQLALDAISLIG